MEAVVLQLYLLLMLSYENVEGLTIHDRQDIFITKEQALSILHHRSKRSLDEECREGCFYEEAREIGLTDAQIKSYLLTYKCSCCLSCTGGYYCDTSNSDYSHINNLQVSCKRDGGWTIWSDWTAWSACSTTCDQGSRSQSRDRSCTNPTTDGGIDCSGVSTESNTETCTDATCLDVLGEWSDWSAWSDTNSCPVTCGGSLKQQSRSRNCSDDSITTTVSAIPIIMNVTCNGSSDEYTNVTCNNDSCPVDGAWSTWSTWTGCSVTCADGTMSRSRECNTPFPQYGGNNCTGNSTEIDTCDTNVTCTNTASCSLSEYSCSGDEVCLNISAKCDGIIDCSQGDDEANCLTYGTYLWWIVVGCVLGYILFNLVALICYKLIHKRCRRRHNNRSTRRIKPYKTTKIQHLKVVRGLSF